MPQQVRRSPTQTNYSLNGKFILSQRLAVIKLNRTPETMKLPTLVNIHHTVSWRHLLPNVVRQKRSDPLKNSFKYGESAAETLFCKQITFLSVHNLLQRIMILTTSECCPYFYGKGVIKERSLNHEVSDRDFASGMIPADNSCYL